LGRTKKLSTIDKQRNEAQRMLISIASSCKLKSGATGGGRQD
jgi:hypothetical protein